MPYASNCTESPRQINWFVITFKSKLVTCIELSLVNVNWHPRLSLITSEGVKFPDDE